MFRKFLVLACVVCAAGSASAQAFRDPTIPNVPFPYLLIGGNSGASTGLLDGKPLDIAFVGADLNDRIANVLVPSGYVMAGYEHANHGGQSRLFYGSMEVKGELAGKISSVKFRRFDPAQCAVAFEHANWQGTAWPFCVIDGESVITDRDAGWWRQVSSVEAPKGLRLSFCGDSASLPCRSYTRDESYVGHASNDTFTEAAISRFDDTNFQLVFMSDPQFGWGASGLRYSDVFATWDDSARQMAATMFMSRHPAINARAAGVIVNGDITNTGERGQLNGFDAAFGRAFDNIYPGLGNHDYDNYLSWAENRDVFNWFDERVSGSPGLIAYDIDGEMARDGSRTAYNGSLAYSWDIGDVHFVQLNNYPSFHVKGDVEVPFDIRKSLDWLDNDLKANGVGKRIVVNMHAIHAQSFSSSGCANPCSPFPSNDSLSEGQRSTNTSADYAEFMRILGDAQGKAKNNIVLVFAGHIHSWAGSAADYDTPKDPPPRYLTSGWATFNIPVFFTGGAQFSLYLVVDFAPTEITVRTIDSKTIAPNEVATVKVDSKGKGQVTVVK